MAWGRMVLLPRWDRPGLVFLRCRVCSPGGHSRYSEELGVLDDQLPDARLSRAALAFVWCVSGEELQGFQHSPGPFEARGRNQSSQKPPPTPRGRRACHCRELPAAPSS